MKFLPRTENQRECTMSMPSLPVSHGAEWTGGDPDGEGRVVSLPTGMSNYYFGTEAECSYIYFFFAIWG